jgi:hypothetical protein
MKSDDRIQELEAKVAELTTLVEQMSTSPVAASAVIEATVVDEPKTSSRRGMLKLAGAAAVGVVAAAATGATQAAADDGLTINAGSATTTANQTRVNYTGGSTSASGFVFQAANGTPFPSNSSVRPAALAGWSAFGNNPPSGVYGFSGNAAGYGTVGRNSASSGTGVLGEAASGTGVVADGSTGVNATGTSTAIVANCSGGDGVVAIGTGAAIRGLSGDFCIAANLSTKANMYLQPNNSFFGTSLKTVPSARVDSHVIGELENVDGDLWWCVVAGTPGTWRKLGGPSAAGAFHALSPGRVYDSRSAAPTPGTISGGQNRTVSVADKRNTTTGAVVTANFVPAGATAVTANITVVSASGAGFLTVNPGGVITVDSSTINWSTAGQVLANGVTLTLNTTRQLSVVAGGGGSTDFIIDISGYYL